MGEVGGKREERRERIPNLQIGITWMSEKHAQGIARKMSSRRWFLWNANVPRYIRLGNEISRRHVSTLASGYVHKHTPKNAPNALPRHTEATQRNATAIGIGLVRIGKLENAPPPSGNVTLGVNVGAFENTVSACSKITIHNRIADAKPARIAILLRFF